MGRPFKTLRDFHAQAIYIRNAIKEAKHDDVIKVQFKDEETYNRTCTRLIEEFKFSNQLTIESFKAEGKLWAYILVQQKKAA
jgi:aconitase B